MSDSVADGYGGTSRRVVEQRIRNRIIEYLELAGSFEAQREYDRAAPIHVPYEVINQWQDWIPSLPWDLSDVYSAAEIEALENVQRVWADAADAVPDDYPTLDSVQRLPAWQRLRDEACAALEIFARRGRLSEDRIDLGE